MRCHHDHHHHHHLLKSLLVAVLLITCGGLAAAQALQPPDVAARAYVLYDVSTNQVLASRDPDTPTEPASLTKLMTAYLVFSALRDKKLTLEQTLPVSERAWRTGMTGASRSFIDVNSQVKVEDLIKGMIVQSGNDATVALAEAIGGSVEQFVDMMNRQAQAFGLKNTGFRNPEGLTAPGHQSTARELAVIATRLIQDFPDELKYYSMRDFTFNKIKQSNRNLLLYRDPSVDGLKTGYTDAAGYCLIATSKRSLPGGQRRLLSVVLGTASAEARANESQKLLNWGYTAFDTVRVFEAHQSLVSAQVWKGEAKEVKLGSAQAVMVTLPKGIADKLKTDVTRPDPLIAPLTKGQKIGSVKVTAPGGELVTEIPLVALEDVPEAGFFGRTLDALRMMMVK